MGLPQTYNPQFLERVRNQQAIYDNVTAQYNLRLHPVVDPSQPHWRVIGMHHLTGAENGGQHHVFLDVLDEQGQRIQQAQLSIIKSGLAPVLVTIDKPDNEPGTNSPLISSDEATVAVADSLPSDQVSNIRTGHDSDGPGNSRFHHSFYIVFQKTGEGTITPAPGPGQARVFNGAQQPFEHGQMIWRRDTDSIYIIFNDQTWASYSNVAPSNVSASAPAGLFTPQFGFGATWQNKPGVREKLGWGTAAEGTLDNATSQQVEGGEQLTIGTTTYLLRNDGQWE